MNNYRYALEPFLKPDMDKNRSRVRECPCSKSNKDGKFIPYKEYDNRGYCHSCGVWFNVAANTCHLCKAEQSFSRYINTETGEQLADHVGKCLHCNFHYTPKQFFEDAKNEGNAPKQKRGEKKVLKSAPKEAKLTSIKEPSFMPFELFKQSLNGYNNNYFVSFLYQHFGTTGANELISRYYIGTSKHWTGATVFWQIDIKGKIRAGKIMLYSPTTGKRIKEPFSHIQWVHSVLKLPDYELKQCLFGEHLLRDNTKPVAIVESEKTAIIASAYLPQFVWLACGSLNSLGAERCAALKGKNVVLFPDLKGFDKWKEKAKELAHLARFTVSDLLESKATERQKEQGLDIADYLLQYDVKCFTQPQPQAEISGVNILIDGIISTPCETITPAEFCSLRMLCVRTAAGYFDVLLSDDGKPLTEMTEPAKRLAEYFNKQFRQVRIEGIECLAHIIR